MRGVNAIVLTATLAFAAFGAFVVPAHGQAPTVTAFEGAWLMAGNGRPSIENATLLVEGANIVQAGPAIDVRVPDGAARLSLAGKTVDANAHRHAHPSQPDTRGAHTGPEARAHYGVSAALSMGTVETEAELQVRGETIHGVARDCATRARPHRGAVLDR